jgi:hypothetical protein
VDELGALVEDGFDSRHAPDWNVVTDLVAWVIATDPGPAFAPPGSRSASSWTSWSTGWRCSCCPGTSTRSRLDQHELALVSVGDGGTLTLVRSRINPYSNKVEAIIDLGAGERTLTLVLPDDMAVPDGTTPPVGDAEDDPPGDESG